MSVGASGGAAVSSPATVWQFNLREYDCVELYLPKKVSYLSGLYGFLDSRLKEREGERTETFAIDGFSIYEVDGAWRDEGTEHHFTDERTLVIRVLLLRTAGSDDDSLQRKIMDLAQHIARLAPGENAIFICHYRQRGFTFLATPETMSRGTQTKLDGIAGQRRARKRKSDQG